jgi:hypothetical protein
MNKIRNIIQAKNMVKKYRSITIEQLLKLNDGVESGYNMVDLLAKITGFGDARTCRMCNVNGKVADDCVGCIYPELTNGNLCYDHYTYDNILGTVSIYQLYTAIRERANYIESIIPLAIVYNKEWAKLNK